MNLTELSYEQAIELIGRRRRQILVHSYIYYDLDKNIIDDCIWSEWAEQLVSLQMAYPEASQKAPYYESFIDFDGSSGFDLPYRMPNIVSTAEHLILYNEKQVRT